MGTMPPAFAAYLAKKKAAKAAPSTAVKSGASAAPVAQPVTQMGGTASTGNTAVAKHIKKQHKVHNAGMQAKPAMTGAAPAVSPYQS